MDDELLSMQDKRRFFRRLDALLAASASSSASSSRDRADAPAPFTRDTAAERNDHSERSDPNGKEGGDGAGRGDRASQRCDPQPTAAKSNTKRAAVAMAGKRKTPSQSEQSKRKKQAPAEQQQLLYGQRVLLVPVGPDVGRRRLEIWQDMVVKLGGSVVASAAPKSRRAAKPSVDWADVDVAIASAQLEPQKAREHYGEATFPPTGVHVYTPEWLVFMLREHRLPPPEANLEWAQHKAAQASADAHRSDASGENFDKDDEEAAESDGGDGSNPYRAGSGEIERAPPVRIDAERVREEEVKLQKEKDRLVQERSVAFYKNNPGFVALAERGRQPGGEEHRQVKPETFVCRQSSLMQANLNAHLTDPLDELMEFLHVERDIWREYMYKKVVSSLKAMRTRVCSVSDLKGLWWAKGRLRDKVVQLLETGRMEKLEAKKNNPRLRALVEMARIWGVGPATAAKLYNMGFKSLHALRQSGESVLSPQQQIGLKHYDDFLTKIPRAEVQQIEKTVVDEVHRILPNATAFACGSYRRGKLSSGDCDVLITDPDEDECFILPELLKRLHESGFITDDLMHNYAQHRGGDHCDTYMGVCRLSPAHLHRRLDIKVYPRRSFGFAMLYFTGSDHFNRSMRLHARKKGWTLSDRALKRVVRMKGGLKVDQGERVVCESEVDVFIALGMEYKVPTERSCFDIRFIEEDEASAKRGKPAAHNGEEDVAAEVEGGD